METQGGDSASGWQAETQAQAPLPRPACLSRVPPSVWTQCDPLGPCVAAQCPRSSLCVSSQPLPAQLVPGGVAGLTLQVGVNSVARETQARGLGRAVPFQSLPFSLGGRQCDPPGVRGVQSAASRGPPSPRGP